MRATKKNPGVMESTTKMKRAPRSDAERQRTELSCIAASLRFLYGEEAVRAHVNLGVVSEELFSRVVTASGSVEVTVYPTDERHPAPESIDAAEIAEGGVTLRAQRRSRPATESEVARLANNGNKAVTFHQEWRHQ